MTDDILKDYKELSGFDNLDMKIEDGTMVITPADAGIVLLSMIQLHNTEAIQYSETLEKNNETIEELLTNNAKLTNYLEELTNKVTEEIKNEILDFLYPISVIDYEGNEITLEELQNGSTE
jgi:predicted transcriptional regulator